MTVHQLADHRRRRAECMAAHPAGRQVVEDATGVDPVAALGCAVIILGIAVVWGLVATGLLVWVRP